MPTNTQFPIGEIRKSVAAIHAEKPFVTTSDIAGAIGCSRETARQKLNALVDEGLLDARQVGGRAKVWYGPQWVTMESEETMASGGPPEDGTDTADLSSDSATSQSPEEEEERVLFFPSRREIVIDSPTDKSQRTLAQTAHLVDSTGDGYLYKIDQTDIWNAPYDSFEKLRSDLIELVGEDKWDGGFESRIKDDWDRAHQFRLHTHPDGFAVLKAADVDVFENVAKRKLEYGDHYSEFLSDTELRVTQGGAAGVKETLYDAGYPVIDERRLEEGASLDVALANGIQLRDYQQDWVEQFGVRRSGVFVGPSGSGKTIAALGAMEAIGGETLIIVPNRELAQQWVDELIDKTTLSKSKIGQYHGGTKQIRPVTIATYDTAAMSRHRKLFNERDWGLVIADECHHSVASTWKRFREIQSKARLGLSATPVREADDPKEIYTLIGPPIGTDWGSLFADGWVEKPDVELIPVPWASDRARERYQRASGSKRLIEAARNPKKHDVVDALLDQHPDQKTLIFVDWIKQGKDLAEELDLPFVYGDTDHDERERIYDRFRSGDLQSLIISRVGDEGIDLPDAEVAILASTMGSSRSQTGQRAGRTMRPLGDATVYLILTKGSGEEDWGRESTQYLAEKGIDVTKTDWEQYR
ncbi:DEAD/DEAH box helicase family protein [Haloarcula hispanica]|uniref:DNA 3'-5' helicase n=2 Tax=Haloarcula hispanica TaxID=51589 RepID=A0A482SZ56_HALHI|nr:DEAD/DEAH box helicase family protein [Haloarcula hispanica]RYJ07706.1 DEAD/DEAH box helicase [Haloarcula hispanica]